MSPNYVDPSSLAPTIIGSGSAFLAVSFILVVVRIWSKLSIVGRLLVEDFLCILAWLLCATSTISSIWSTEMGFGRHFSDVKLEWIFQTKYPEALFVMSLCAMASLTVIQLSILFFYLRIIPSKLFRRFIYATMAYVVAAGLGVFLALVFGCHPIEASWKLDRFITANCLDYFAIYRWGTILNAVADFFVFVLPLPFIYRSQLPGLQKFHVLLVFCLGGFVVITGFVLIGLVVKTGAQNDFTWHGAIPMIGAAIEINTAIICSCLPAFKHLLSILSPRFFSYNYQAGGMHPRHGPVITPSFVVGQTSQQQRQEWMDLEKDGSNEHEGFSLGYMGSQANVTRSLSARSGGSMDTVVAEENYATESLDDRPVPLDGDNMRNSMK